MAIATELQTRTKRITADEFAALPDIDGAAYVELIEGEIIVAGGASFPHQDKSWKMTLFLGSRIKKGTWLAAPMAVQFDVVNTFEPDIFWISPDNTRCTLHDARTWVGAPDLVIEILSPSTQRRDRDKKFRVYESSGVREYWLVDPDDDFLEVYHLLDGKYTRIAIVGLGEQFESPTLALQIQVDGLFKGE